MGILDPKPLTVTAANATFLTVLVHNGTAYPARPTGAPAGMVRYVGPSSPTGALSGDEWLDTSTADTTAPSAVTGLTAGTATTTTVPLSWTAATDDVAVAGYEYSTNGTTYTSTGSTGTTYTVTGLTANTAYTIYVRAFDAAGNRGTAASVAKTTAASADTTAPSALTGLAAGTPTATAIPLTWTASTDNVAVTGYEYSTNGTTWVSTGSTATSYTVTGLTASTAYTIQVRAFDAAGNKGTAGSVNATTAAGASYISTVSALSPTYFLPLDDTAAPPRQIGSATGTITVTGTPTFGGPSLGGGTASVNFPNSGAAYVAPPNTTLDGVATGTIMAVIKLDALPASTLGIMGKNLAWKLTANNLGRMSVSGFGGTGINNNTTHQLAAATAYHVAVTYDGTTLKLFRNGILAQSAASTGAIASSTSYPGAIGAVSSSAGLGGNMFGAALWSGTALTDAQVLSCAQAAGF